MSVPFVNHAVSYNNGRTWHVVIAERRINCVSTRCKPKRWIEDSTMLHMRGEDTMSLLDKFCARCAP